MENPDTEIIMLIYNNILILSVFLGIWKIIEHFILVPIINRKRALRGYQEDEEEDDPTPQRRDKSSNGQPRRGYVEQVLPHEAWMKVVQDRPDEVPHVLIVGSTGTGKTWLAQAIATERDGYVAILDPKWRPNKWGGTPTVTIDDDLSYTSLEKACQKLLEELKSRQVSLKQGVETFTPLTVVVEELPTILDECPTAPTLFKRLGQLGRELRIRVIGLSQSDRVKTLKLEGEGDTRSNYTFIRLGDHAIKGCPPAAKLNRPATIEFRGLQIPIDTNQVPTLIKRPISQNRWYKAVSVSSIDKVIDFPPEPKGHWTDEHLKVAMWLAKDPDISQREVARRLWPHTDGRGGYNVKAKKIIEEVYRVIEGEFEMVQSVSNGQ